MTKSGMGVAYLIYITRAKVYARASPHRSLHKSTTAPEDAESTLLEPARLAEMNETCSLFGTVGDARAPPGR